ncbi:MAG: serine hydrolase [Caldilineaceae bacterium]|nr:serine hydrolase [Caldilineaceae bacterium]
MMPFRKFLILLSILALFVTTLPSVAQAAPTRQAPIDALSLPADPTVAAQSDGVVDDLVAAAGVLPSSLYDPDEIGWASIRGLSSSAFSDHFNAMKDEYLMVDIEVDEIDGEQRVAAVWQENTDKRGWAEHRNLDTDQFHEKWTTYKEAGYRLIDQEVYQLSGQWRYAGIWVQNKENLAWASYRNLTSEEFSQKFTEFKEAGYLMVDVEGYSTSGGLRYAMLWVQNTEQLDWAEYRNLSSDEFAKKFNELKGKYRMWEVESYRHNGVQYYAGIWVENKNGRGWAEYRDMTESSYRNRWYRMRDLGYRLINFEVYPTANGERYAGVWRQNSDRPDWALREQVDNLAQNHLDTFTVPGLSVAIAKDGEIQYMRGFGFQDVDAGVWYSARTLNRLASVAKTVGAVLTLRLWQNGVIDDLDADSDTILASLPAHHTHTVRQLLSNRAGIGHYPDYNVTVQQYNTALAASQNFWNTDNNPNVAGTQLLYTPGTDCVYSTHAHTVLGAVLEAATGKDINTLVEDELSAPFGLPTLQSENRNDGDENRSLVYNQNNNAAAADNISWKILGGGLEASAYDLLRFGMKTIDGTIINADSLTELQLAPNPTNCSDPNWGFMGNYALGMQVGTQKGTTVLWKGGNQLGSNTHLRIYPDEDLVIVVLANRNENHSTQTLATQIGDLILDAEAAAGEADAGYDFGGMVHRVQGGLQAFFNQAQQLVLTNIGRQGNEVMTSQLGQATFWQSALEMAFDIQSTTPMQSRFAAKDTAGNALSTMTMAASSSGLELTATFGEQPYAIQYLLDNTIIDRLASQPGSRQSALINWDELWCIMDLPSGLPSELCRLTIEYYQNQTGAYEWNIRLAEPITLINSQDQPMQVNRVRFVTTGETLHAASQHAESSLAAMDMQLMNLEQMTILSAQHGGAEFVPVLPSDGQTPGAFNQQIFLPMVLQ